jgi:hypothetical protein
MLFERRHFRFDRESAVHLVCEFTRLIQFFFIHLVTYLYPNRRNS